MERARADLDRQGYCVVEDVLSAAEVAALKARLVEQAAGEQARGVAFHDGGRWTGSGSAMPNQRVWMLLNKGKVFRDLVVRPIVDELVGHLLGDEFLLSSLTANIAHPGGEPMVLHTDQGYLGMWTPVPVVANIIWMLDDFTDANGGTRIVPRSHLNDKATPRSSSYTAPGPANQPTPEDTIAAEGKAGSILCFDGRLWHGTGANRSGGPRHGLLSYYCRPYLRQQENFSLGLLPELSHSERPALLKRLGFTPWSGLGRIESPRPAVPLHVRRDIVGPLGNDGRQIDV